MEILKVSKSSSPNSVSKAISAVIKNKGEVEIQAIGAGACNQTIKSIAITREYLTSAGIDLICRPSFTKILINDEEKTAIRFILTIK